MATRDLNINITETRTGNALVSTARDLDKLAHGADATGDKFAGLSRDTKTLERDIKATEDRIRDLGAQFARTGDKGLFGDLRNERSFLRELERVRKDIAPVAAKGLLEGLDFSEMVAESKGALIAGGAALGLSMAPALAGIISSAVLGAVGAGGVVGGALLAARDQRVKNAWGELGHSIMDELEPVGAAFVDPMVEAAATFKTAFGDSGLVSTLERAAVLVDPLSKAFAGFGANLVPGIDAAITGSLPTWQVLSHDLPALGTSISRMLGSMADAGPQAALAMHDFFDVMEGGVESVGPAVEGLTDLYSVTRGLNQSFKDLTGVRPFGDIIPTFGLLEALGKLIGGETEPTLEQLGEAAHKAEVEFEAARDEWEASADALKKMNEQLLASNDAMLSAAEATDQVHADMQKLSQSVYDNGISLDDHTEAGLNNRDMIRGLIQDLKDVYEADVKAGMSTADASIKYSEQANILQTQLTKELGFAAGGVEALIGSMKNIPPVITIDFIQRYTTEGVPLGEHSGARFSETYRITPGGFQEFAMGGMVQGPAGSAQMALVHAGEAVLTPEQLAAMSAGAAGGGAPPINLNVQIGTETLRRILINEATGRGVPQSTIAFAYP